MDVLSAVKEMKVEGLQRIADPIILNILYEIEDSLNISKLQEIIVDIYGEANLLLNPNKRKFIFEYLPEKVAKELCAFLHVNCSASENVWNKITSLNFNPTRKIKLLEFFKVKNANEYCSFETVEQVSDIITVSPKYPMCQGSCHLN